MDEHAVSPIEPEGARVIRRQWHDGQWYFSVIDVIRVLTDTNNPRIYWGVLKTRLRDESASELITNCKQLKMRALDGKLRATDAANAENMLRIVQSIPSPKAEPIKQWLAQVGAERLEDVAASLDEASRRLLMRDEVADKNTKLTHTAANAGLVTSRDFAVFHDHGYKGLYAGETSAMIAQRKGLAKSEHILDWMGSEELAANWFRITQAEAKLRRDGVDNKAAANAVHHQVGRTVRETIAQLGGTMPENLPTPTNSIRELQRQEQKQLESGRQPSLFEPPE
ncbi:MAG TPA: BRO family protein [Ktedonobacterales bacterium]|nr:BRO family protein [Ktedonobacterales bacterium]